MSIPSIPPEDLLHGPLTARRAADEGEQRGDDTLAPGASFGARLPSSRHALPFVGPLVDRVRRIATPLFRWLRANSFVPAWLPQPWRRSALGYLVAVLGQLLAVVITTALDRAFADFSVSGLLPALVIVAVALTFGAGPSLLATFVGVPLIDFFLLPPFDTFTKVGPGSGIGLGLLLAVGVIISVVASRVETQRRRAQTLAAEREAVLEAVPDGLLVFDEYRRPVRVNPAARRLLALDQRTDQLPPADYGALLAGGDLAGGTNPPEQWPLNRVLRGETLKGTSSVDTVVATFDGGTATVNMSGAPVRDGKGHLVGAAIVLHDLRGQRQLERRTHEALAALLAMAQVLVSSEEGEVFDETYAAGPVAKRLADLTCSVLGCRRVAILAVDPQTDAPQTIAIAGFSSEQERQWWAEQQEGLPLAAWPDQALVGRLRAGEVVTFDISQPPFNDQANPYQIRGVLMAPMRMGERLVGLLSLDHAGLPHTYTHNEMALAGAVAKLVGLVVERERLFQQREEARAHALALHDANERMNAFLGVASHELKTPVTSLKVNVQLGARWLAKLTTAAAKVDDSFAGAVEPIRELLERSDRTMVRLTRLVDDLLDVSRIRAGKLELRREPGDLVAIVRDVVHEQRAVSAEDGPARRIVLELPDVATVPIDADADRIGQVLTNYLTNALKYSPPEAPVVVRLEVFPAAPPLAGTGADITSNVTQPSPTRRGDLASPVVAWDHPGVPSTAGGEVTASAGHHPSRLTTPAPVGEGLGGGVARVAVRDRGPGLPQEEHEAIWEPFHRAQGVEVMSGSGVGLGLGLYISRSIVERHGGTVGVESAAQGPSNVDCADQPPHAGPGSTFWFTLPLAS